MLINVIIPAYNSENTIERAINSVLKLKTKVNIRVLVVDDGSTDKTYSIAEGYGKQITLLRNHCKGVSSARNTGLEFIISEDLKESWVTFLDADDLLIEDAFIEFATGKYTSFDYIGFCFSKGEYFHNKSVSPEEASFYAIKSLKNSSYNFNSPWGRIINLNFIKKHNIRFEESLKYKEDMLFNIQCFKNNPKILIINDIGYKHINNSESVVNNFIPSALNDERYIFNEIKKIFSGRNKLDEIEKMVGAIKLTFVYVFPKNMNQKLLSGSKNRFREVKDFLGDVTLVLALKELDKIDFIIITLYKLGLYRTMKLLFRLKGRL